MRCIGTHGAWFAGLIAFIVCFSTVCGNAAAAPAPGGVAGVTLWFTGSSYNGTIWTDQSGSGVVSAQPTARGGWTNPGVIAMDANFNPGASFSGSNQALTGNLNISMFGNANTYMFGVSKWNGTIGGGFADLLAGWNNEGAQGLGFDVGKSSYMADSSGTDVAGPFQVPTTGTSTPFILSDCYYPTALSVFGATVWQNGIIGTPSSLNGNVTRQNNQFELGARTAGGFQDNRVWVGSIDEVIMYNSATLTAQQISQIRSYLAIKYGITLGFNTNSLASAGTNYLSSTGATVWTGASTNAPYHHNVAGIGKDAASGLDQRVSHSVNPNAVDVTIANGTSLVTTSQAGNAAFASDQTFVMWGDDGGSTTLQTSGNPPANRMPRTWFVQTTGTGSTQLTVQVLASAFSGVTSKAAIFVTNGVASAVATPLVCGATYCTVTIPTFSAATGFYFTFGTFPQLQGTVFEDINYGGGAGRSSAAASGVGIPGIAVELYDGSGAFVATTTTATDGTYTLTANALAGNYYTVRAVTPAKSSRTGGSTAGLLGVQTYRTDATSAGTGDRTPTALVTDHVGGETPALADAGAHTGSATLASLTTSTTTAQSITTVSLHALGMTGLDFGYNFDTVVNANNSGQGSLAQFITNANALGGVSNLAQVGQAAATQTSIFMISDGGAHPGLRAGIPTGLTSGVAAINVTAAYPTIGNAATVIDGTTQTTNVPGTNAGTLGAGGTVGTMATALLTIAKPTVQIVGTTALLAGLTLGASNCTVRGIAISGFHTGNAYGDIVISGTGTAGTLIEKNAIGTSATSFSSPGTDSGVGIFADASGGGTISNNVIGFIDQNLMTLQNTSNWTVSGNELRSTYGDPVSAVYVKASSLVTIANNLIVGNAGAGVFAASSSGSITIQNNTLSGNGVSLAGHTPSVTPAVQLDGANNTMTRNIVNGNYGAGILVMSGSLNNVLSQNSIFGNGTVVAANGAAATGEIGIDLTIAGDSGNGKAPYITPNVNGGTGAGGNNLFAFPVLDSAFISGSKLVVTGFARPGATIELFLADASPPSGFGQGKTYLATAIEGSASNPIDGDSTTGTYTNPGGNTHIGTDTTNRFLFTIPLPGGVSANSVLTATSTLSANGTSEFGPNITVAGSGPNIATVLSGPLTGLPGQDLTYTGTFTNSGVAQAYNVSIVDPLTTFTDFKLGSVSTNLTGTNLTLSPLQYSKDFGATWTYTPVPGGGGAPGNYDRLVTNVRFLFTGTLSNSSPNNHGTFTLTVRIQ